MILSGDAAVIQLGDEQFLARLQSYLELAPTLRERVPDIDYVDLRFDERIYVRPARTSARQPAAARRQARQRRRGATTGVTAKRRTEWRVKNDIWSGSTSARRR